MKVSSQPWKQHHVPERIYASWCRRFGDAMARRLCELVHAKRLRAANAAVELEERLAAAAHRKGPQVTPENGIGAEIEWEVSPHTYARLHNDSLVEDGCEGGEYLQSEDYMKWFLKRNERNRRRTAPHSNRVGYSARLEAARRAREQEQAATMARATTILETAATEGRQKLLT